jgi:dihydrofolate synthase/folylpolyglutamate synthase
VDYRYAEKFINNFENRMEGFDLETIKELLAAAGISGKGLRIVHVAGTNGKGSVCAFIAAALAEQGYKTGSYFSPHVHSVRERIRVNGKPVSRKGFAAAVGKMKAFAGTPKSRPSYFEMLTAVAMQHFTDCGAEFVVLEAGMGGRLDATNIFTPEVSVITSVSKEHEAYLGGSISRIAAEKAGIIKEGVPVVTLKGNAGIGQIREAAKAKRAPLVIPEYRVKDVSVKGSTFDMVKPFQLKGIRTGMAGRWQVDNAALAAAALHCLRRKGTDVSVKSVRQGIKKAWLAGRMQVLRKKPLVIADVAHNPAAAEALAGAIKLHDFERLIAVFSCMRDKDAKGMLDKVKPDLLVICGIGGERAMPPEELAMLCRKNCAAAGGPEEALREALGFASPEDLILIFGSHRLMGEALKGIPKSLSRADT